MRRRMNHREYNRMNGDERRKKTDTRGQQREGIDEGGWALPVMLVGLGGERKKKDEEVKKLWTGARCSPEPLSLSPYPT